MCIIGRIIIIIQSKATIKKVGNVPKDSLGGEMVVNTRMELCGAFINRMNVTYVNYTVKGKPKDKKKGR